MNVEDFENLKLIPELLAAVEQMSERMAKFAPPVTTKKEVAKFLGKSERTINNYITQGLLKEDYHFYRKNDRIIVFIESAISEFKEKLNKGIVYEKVKI